MKFSLPWARASLTTKETPKQASHTINTLKKKINPIPLTLAINKAHKKNVIKLKNSNNIIKIKAWLHCRANKKTKTIKLKKNIGLINLNTISPSVKLTTLKININKNNIKNNYNYKNKFYLYK